MLDSKIEILLLKFITVSEFLEWNIERLLFLILLNTKGSFLPYILVDSILAYGNQV